MSGAPVGWVKRSTDPTSSDRSVGSSLTLGPTYDKAGRTWPRWLRRGPLELAASLVIGAGVLMLLQPLSITLYSYSFITTLTGVVAFMIVSKFPD